MPFSLLDPQPAPRDSTLLWENLGSGLYPEELAVELDDGTLVAVSVESGLVENGGGSVWIKGCARAIEECGQTQTCPNGSSSEPMHLESHLSYTASPLMLAQHGLNALKREVLLALLGEEPSLTIDVDGENVPAVAWSEEVRLNASIRPTVAMANATGVGDVGSLLGL